MSRTPTPLALASSLPKLQNLPQPPDLPCFELTYICDGRTYKALARGRNQTAASYEGICALVDKCPDFDPETARLTAAVKVS